MKTILFASLVAGIWAESSSSSSEARKDDKAWQISQEREMGMKLHHGRMVPAVDAQTCDAPYASLEMGNSLYYQTDVWNSGAAAPGWWECIYFNNGQTSVAYSIFASDGNNQVKAYPSIVAGWNFGSGYKYGYGAGGFPYDTQSSGSATTSFSVSHNNNGNYEAYDVAYDLWFSDDPNLSGNGTPGLELMIWLTCVVQNPAGSNRGNANIGGMEWEVWFGQGGSNTAVISFRPTNYVWSVNNISIMDFVNWMKQNGYSSNTPRYMIGLQAGVEIAQGAGGFNNTYFGLSVNDGDGNKWVSSYPAPQ